MNNLNFIDTNNLKFRHNNSGVTAIYKDKKIILGSLSVVAENIEFSDLQLLKLGQIELDFQCAVRGLPNHPVSNTQIFSGVNFENYIGPFYKYLQPRIFDNFINEGKWQLGCIEQYRTIENMKQRDEFEGYSLINLILNNHLISTVCNSGFNYLIFCGTSNDNSNLHKEQFGEKKICIPNVNSFAEAIRKSISAKRYYIQRVTYDSVKLFINRNSISNNKISLDNILVEPFFEYLKDNILYPSLFIKPETFKLENEVRIVFEMNKDYKKPLKFQNIGLKYFIES